MFDGLANDFISNGQHTTGRTALNYTLVHRKRTEVSRIEKAGNGLAEIKDTAYHSSGCKDCCVMVRDTVQSAISVPLFRGVWLPPSSVYIMKSITIRLLRRIRKVYNNKAF